MRVITIAKELSLRDIIDVAYNRVRVELSDDSVKKMRFSREFVRDAIRSGRVIYGVSTGVGALAKEVLPKEEAEKFQRNILLSHAVGFGPPTPPEIVRATIFLRANMLAKGFSGIRPEIVILMLSLLNNDIIPIVPKYGSVGASGDLAQLSHIALVLVGYRGAKALYKGKIIEGEELRKLLYDVYTRDLEAFYEKHGNSDEEVLIGHKAIEEDDFLVKLSYKEALSLINGTEFESAMVAIAIHRAKNLLEHALIAFSMSMEAVRGIINAFDPRVIGLLNHKSAEWTASRVRSLVKNSKMIIDSNAEIKLSELISGFYRDGESLRIVITKDKIVETGVDPEGILATLRKKLGVDAQLVVKPDEFVIIIKSYINPGEVVFTWSELGFVQDPYIFRCAPKVFGSIKEAIDWAEKLLVEEMNSITDNPLIICEADICQVISAGNFHGQILALVADTLAIALSYLGGFSERRIFRLLDPHLNRNLPPFLAIRSGVNSGLMITQYVAAALSAINNILAHPASVYSLPTSANQEDWNSMGANAAWKLLEIENHLVRIIATEILCAAQAIYLRTRGKIELLGEGTKKFLEKLSSIIKLPIEDDRYFKEDLEKIENIITSVG